MTTFTRNTLEIDWISFQMAFGRDLCNDGAVPCLTYLDSCLGDIWWVTKYDDDAECELGISERENRATRECMASDPDRFLFLPGLTHGEHHDILKEFLASAWTPDESRRRRVREVYFGSIGGWKKQVGDDQATVMYEDYRDARVREMAEDFLRRNGVERWNFR